MVKLFEKWRAMTCLEKWFFSNFQMKRFFLFLTAMLISGVCGGTVEAGNAKAVIEDNIVGAPYEVIEVDGAPPERAKHGIFVTVVPNVLVAEGSHQLILLRREIDLPEQVNSKEILKITVKEGQRYRLGIKNGKPILVEVRR